MSLVNEKSAIGPIHHDVVIIDTRDTTVIDYIGLRIGPSKNYLDDIQFENFMPSKLDTYLCATYILCFTHI